MDWRLVLCEERNQRGQCCTHWFRETAAAAMPGTAADRKDAQCNREMDEANPRKDQLQSEAANALRDAAGKAKDAQCNREMDDESTTQKDQLQYEAANALRDAAEEAFCDNEWGESNALVRRSQKEELSEAKSKAQKEELRGEAARPKMTLGKFEPNARKDEVPKAQKEELRGEAARPKMTLGKFKPNARKDEVQGESTTEKAFCNEGVGQSKSSQRSVAGPGGGG